MSFYEIDMFVKKYFLLLVQLFAFSELHSQLCNGSLGDPIVNITFGSGSNPGPALTTTTNLQYINSDCPADGSYTMRNDIQPCFGNTWHNLNSDHTGNANGYFMLINASLQKSEFYLNTVKGLCPNTTYEYAAWIMNVLMPFACSGNGINPNLTFNIEKTDGTILQTYSTGDIIATANPAWKQYGFFFATPADASDVVVRIINNSSGGCGNDLAIDDITFRPCGPRLTSYIVGEQGTTKQLCEGDNADVTLSCHISTGYSNPSYQWQESLDTGRTYKDIPGVTDTTFVKFVPNNTPAGAYLYRLSAGEGTNMRLPSCSISSDPLTIDIKSKSAVNARSNSPVCEGAPLILSASGGTEYLWSGVNGYSGSGSPATIDNALITNSGTYYVSVTSGGICKQQDSTIVNIIPAPVAKTSFTSKTICQGDSVFLQSSGGTSYLWSPAAGLSSSVIADPLARPEDTIQYTVLVTNEASCMDSATVTINVIPKLHADAGPDQNILEGQSVQLAAAVSDGDNSYSWLPDIFINNAHVLNPIVNPGNDITYFFTASSNNGCGISNDSVRIHVFKKVVIPNAFSPNGDGINDKWNIKALTSYSNYALSVFNRYGQIVFTTKNYSKPWDGTYNGKPLPVGTYYYLINLTQGLHLLKGYVVILR